MNPLDSAVKSVITAWAGFGVKSGALTGLAANATVFSFRNLASPLILVKRLSVGFTTTTAFTVGQIVDFGAYFARGFTANDTGGTALTLNGTNNSYNTKLASATNILAQVGATGAITPGTRTLDAQPLGMQAGFSAGVGASIPLFAADNLFENMDPDYPVVLALNEGLIINALTAFGAAGVGTLYVEMEYAEASSF